MYRYLMFVFLSLILIVVGCRESPNINPTPNNQLNNNQLDVDLTKLSTNQSIDQTYSNQAKDSLKTNQDLTSIKAVNTDKDLVITFEVDHLKRFQLEKIRKKIAKKMKKEFSNMKVIVSTDQKIILGLDQIEQEIQKNHITKKQLEKQIKYLVKLAKEET